MGSLSAKNASEKFSCLGTFNVLSNVLVLVTSKFFQISRVESGQISDQGKIIPDPTLVQMDGLGLFWPFCSYLRKIKCPAFL